MKQTIPLLILLSLSVAGCKTTEIDPLTVEHVVMPHPFPEDGWIMQTRRDGTTEWNRWNKENEFLSLAITRESPDRSVQEQRGSIDAHARNYIAKTFDSATILEDKIGISDRSIWETELEFPSGKKVYSLCALLHGNDASYFITKQWESLEEYKKESDVWLSYLKAIRIEDPRSKMSEQDA